MGDFYSVGLFTYLKHVNQLSFLQINLHFLHDFDIWHAMGSNIEFRYHPPPCGRQQQLQHAQPKGMSYICYMLC